MDARNIYLVGDFNKWNKTSVPMECRKNGEFVRSLTLETNRDYQLKYYVEQMVWKNDLQADKYTHSLHENCENSVVCV